MMIKVGYLGGLLFLEQDDDEIVLRRVFHPETPIFHHFLRLQVNQNHDIVGLVDWEERKTYRYHEGGTYTVFIPDKEPSFRMPRTHNYKPRKRFPIERIMNANQDSR